MLSQPLEIGAVLGDWRIDGPIGIGGMGAVYAATHTAIGKRAAIKVVRADLSANPLTTERFFQEARVVNQVRHPAIIDIFHIGTLEDGRPYLVMELLQGKTLGQKMTEGRILPVEAIDILLEVCDGLAAAHAAGVVHRDLKPDNIFLSEGAAGIEVKLVDWGIAKLMDWLPTSGTLTTTGTLVGTPQYMSPEQARGKAIDGRTDVYALGAIAYELFLEGPPFSADNVADLVTMQLREPPPPPSELWPDIPSALESLLLAMLAKRPEGRPSLDDVQQTLRGLRGELGTRRRCISGRMRPLPSPTPLDVLDRAPTWGMAPAIVPAADTGPTRVPRRRPVTEAIAAVATFFVLAAAGVTVTQLVRDPGVLAAAAVAGRGPIPLAQPVAPIDTPSVAAAGAPVEASLVPANQLPSDGPAVLDLRVEPETATVHIGGVATRAVDGRLVRPIDVGELTLEVTAPGRVTYRRTLEVGPGTVLLEVELRSTGRPQRPLQHVPESRRAVLDVDPDGLIDPFE